MSSKHAPLHVVLALFFIALFAFALGRLSVNALLFLSVVALAGSMLLGIFVSLHPDRAWLKERRSALSVLFASLGVAGALVASIQGLRANQESFGFQDQLTSALQRISEQEKELALVRTEAAKMRDDAARTHALNTELQQKLLDQSTQLKELAVQRVGEATGGRGFAYLDLAPAALESGVALQAHVKGDYNLRQVKYRIADAAPVELGDLAPSSSRRVDTVLHPARESASRYKITIMALNGPVQEELEVRFNPDGQRWERRVRVLRGNEVVLERGWGR